MRFLNLILFCLCGGTGFGGVLVHPQTIPIATAGGGGPNTYYDATTAHTSQHGINTASWQVLTVVAASGTATKCRVFPIQYFGGACNVKAALYDSAGTTLLAQANAQSVTTSGAYVEFTFTASTAVTGGQNYILAFMADTGNTEFGFGASGSGQSDANYHFDSSGMVYASFPPASLPSSGTSAGNITCGLFVQ